MTLRRTEVKSKRGEIRGKKRVHVASEDDDGLGAEGALAEAEALGLLLALELVHLVEHAHLALLENRR